MIYCGQLLDAITCPMSGNGWVEGFYHVQCNSVQTESLHDYKAISFWNCHATSVNYTCLDWLINSGLSPM